MCLAYLGWPFKVKFVFFWHALPTKVHHFHGDWQMGCHSCHTLHERNWPWRGAFQNAKSKLAYLNWIVLYVIVIRGRMWIIVWMRSIYCRVPAGRGLRKAALGPGHDKTRAINPLVRTQDIHKTLTKRIQTIKPLKWNIRANTRPSLTKAGWAWHATISIRGPDLFLKYFYFLFGPGLFYLLLCLLKFFWLF